MGLCDYFTLFVQHLVVYAKAGILHEFHLCRYYYIAGIVERLYEIAGGRQKYGTYFRVAERRGEAGKFPVIHPRCLYILEVSHVIYMTKEVHLAPVYSQWQFYRVVFHTAKVRITVILINLQRQT